MLRELLIPLAAGFAFAILSAHADNTTGTAGSAQSRDVASEGQVPRERVEDPDQLPTVKLQPTMKVQALDESELSAGEKERKKLEENLRSNNRGMVRGQPLN